MHLASHFPRETLLIPQSSPFPYLIKLQPPFPPLPLACALQGHTLQDIHSASVDTFRLQINGFKYQQMRAVRGGEGRNGKGTRDEMRLEGGRG